MDTKSIIEKAGGPAAVAKLFDISSQAVSQWETVPPNRVLKLEEVTGVSRHLMRPDIYGTKPTAERRAG